MDKNTYMPYAINWFIRGDKVWFISTYGNALMEIDLNNKKVKCLHIISEPKFKPNQSCFFYNDSIYCLPDTSQCIRVYDLKNACMRDIPIVFDKKRSAIADYCYLKDSEELLMYFDEQRSLMRFSLNEERITSCRFVAENIEDVRITRLNNSLFFTSFRSDKIYEYDIFSEEVREHEVNSFENGLYAICAYDNSLYFSGSEHFIYRWQEGEDKCQRIPLPNGYGEHNAKFKQKGEEADSSVLGVFNKIVFLNGCLWLIPVKDNNLLCYDVIKNKYFEMKLPDENESLEAIEARYDYIKYWFLYERESRYFGLYSFNNEWVVEIDTLNKTCEVLSFDTSEIPWDELLIFETSKKTIEIWLAELNGGNPSVYNQNYVGRKIYNIIKK